MSPEDAGAEGWDSPPERLYRRVTRSAPCGVESREETRHQPEDEAEGEVLEAPVAERQRVAEQCLVDNSADGETEHHAQYRTDEPHQEGFSQQESQDCESLVAHRPEDTDLAAAFDCRHQHHVHDTDAGDEQRHGADTDEKDVDLCEQLEDLANVVLEVADGVLLFLMKILYSRISQFVLVDYTTI